MTRETFIGLAKGAALLAFIVLAAIVAATPAPAQEPPAAPQLPACGPRDGIVAALERKWGERRVGVGLQNRGSVTEVFASAETGTWTILQTRPDGVACARAAGEGWVTETPPPGAPS